MSSVVIHLAAQSPVVKYATQCWHCRRPGLSPTPPQHHSFKHIISARQLEQQQVAWVAFLPFRPFYFLKTCCGTNLFCAKNCLCLGKPPPPQVLPSKVALEPAIAEKFLSGSFPGQRRDGWGKARSSLRPERPKVQANTFASVFTFCLTEIQLNWQPPNAFPGYTEMHRGSLQCFLILS